MADNPIADAPTMSSPASTILTPPTPPGLTPTPSVGAGLAAQIVAKMQAKRSQAKYDFRQVISALTADNLLPDVSPDQGLQMPPDLR